MTKILIIIALLLINIGVTGLIVYSRPATIIRIYENKKVIYV